MHANQRNHQCKKCERKFKSAAHLNRHKNSVHIGNRPFQCDICEKTYKTASVLQEHRQQVHEPPKHECNVCQKKFTSSNGLNSHMATAHDVGTKETISCEICEKLFTHHSNLNRHKATVHREKVGNIESFVCELCGQQFLTKKYANQHKIEVHEEKRFSCDECDYKCSALNNLNKHKRSRHSKNPDDNYTNCEICQKRLTIGSLHSHMKLIHHKMGFEESVCEFCEKTFTTKSGLKRHISTVHKLERRFKCEYCEQMFQRSSQLNKHRISLHSK